MAKRKPPILVVTLTDDQMGQVYDILDNIETDLSDYSPAFEDLEQFIRKYDEAAKNYIELQAKRKGKPMTKTAKRELLEPLFFLLWVSENAKLCDGDRKRLNDWLKERLTVTDDTEENE